MGKCITINSCKDCPYSGVDYFREHFMKAWCGHSQMRWTNNNWEWHSKVIEEESEYLAFPPWCPLDDAADESSIGDLTPEDIQRINETARRIKNAKRCNMSSIKRVDGRYGCNGCFLYTYYIDDYKSCHYCKKPLKYPSIDAHKQFITFNYTIIDDPNVQPMNCPYPERWEHE